MFWASLIFGILALSPQGYATTYYVSTAGNDSGAGTASSPFATIQRAADVVSPGDTILVAQGRYTERVTLHISGTQSAPITLKNIPGQQVILDGGGLLVFNGWGVALGWMTIEGLEITNVPDNGIFFNSAHDVTFRGNFIHDNPQQGILGNGYRITFDANTIARNGLPYAVNNSGNSWCYPDCDNKYHGVYMAGTYNTFTNNLIYGNAAYGIQIAAYPWDPSDSNHPAGPEYTGATGWLISNNVFAFQLNRSGIVLWKSGAGNNIIQNNIFFENSLSGAANSNGIDCEGCGSGNIFLNNLFSSSQGWASIAGFAGGSYSESASLFSNPLFVDASGNDFHLQGASPAIDKGTALSAPATAYEGGARPQGSGYDIGAYEFASGVTDGIVPQVSIISPANGSTVSKVL